ncbi:MAG: hypothetical protein K2N00_13190, partial [Lachnospiraceae bacterium]|nr:hypothetical protein [Lachnospiraceae bacterium]
MNCCWIILLLLFCGQNGNVLNGRSNCACEESGRSAGPSRRMQDQDNCPCEDSRESRESRFEPRFEARPYNGNGSTCGCDGENN